MILLLNNNFFPDSEKTKMQSFTLAAKHLTEKHTGPNLTKEIEEILSSLGVRSSQIVGGTTDGGGNIVNGVKSVCGNDNHIRCMCHVFNVIIRRCLEKMKMLMSIIQKVKKFVTHMKHSYLVMDLYRELQMLCGVSEHEVKFLIQSIITRWNSELYCIKRFLDMIEHIMELVRSPTYNGPEIPTKEEIKLLEEYVSLMEPFASVTTLLSGERYVTGQVVFPLI